MKLIDKAALVAEIEKRINEINLDSIEGWRYRLQREHDIEVMKNILSLIDTLEVKEVNLEEKATQLSQKYFPDEENIWARSNIEAHKCKSACIEMVEWIKTQKGE